MNYYRKVSKYELDRRTVDWVAQYKEKERQFTANAKVRREEEYSKKDYKKKEKLVDRLVKISVLNRERKAYLADRQQTARKNQEILSNMIKEVNDLQSNNTPNYELDRSRSKTPVKRDYSETKSNNTYAGAGTAKRM